MMEINFQIFNELPGVQSVLLLNFRSTNSKLTFTQYKQKFINTIQLHNPAKFGNAIIVPSDDKYSTIFIEEHLAS